MMIVLDTNVLVAGLLSPYGAPARVLQLVLAHRVRLCFDTRILIEYRAVLSRPKFDFDDHAVHTLIEFIESTGELAAATPWSAALPDPDDVMFLEVARAGWADCVVTGNLRHFPVNYAGSCHGSNAVAIP